MWYNTFQYPHNFKLKLNSKIQKQFISFCNEEIFYSSEKDTVATLSIKFNKNIFADFKFEEIDKKFLLYTLNHFQEKKLEFNETNLIEFFKNPVNNPNHVLFIANTHSYATVKKAAQFLDLANPQEEYLWKEYLADCQTLLSDNYFTSSSFKSLLDVKKNIICDYSIGLERIKNDMLNLDSEFTIDVETLLRTDLIIKKPLKYKELIEFLFDQGFISPVMLLPDSLGGQTLFEYTSLRCQDSTVWWIEKMLFDYEDSFNYSEMIVYFEAQIKPGSHFFIFNEQLKNYNEMIKIMKSINIKESLEKSLKIKKRLIDKPIKI